jgi:hypothetical protein
MAMNDRISCPYFIDPERLVKTIFIICLISVGILFFLDFVQNVAKVWYFKRFKDLSNVAMENSFGTWFSIVLNFMAGMAATLPALYNSKILHRRGRATAWALIALFFVYVSLDDHLVFHERMSGGLGPVILSKVLGEQVRFATYEWIYLFVPLFAIFGVFMLVFMYKEMKRGKFRVLLVLALTLWAAAVGMDAWEGAGMPYLGLTGTSGIERFKVRHTLMLVEETFEMLGSTLFLYLFLSHVSTLLIGGRFSLVFRRNGEEGGAEEPSEK